MFDPPQDNSGPKHEPSRVAMRASAQAASRGAIWVQPEATPSAIMNTDHFGPGSTRGFEPTR
jgi:hypothetical protein